MAAFAGIVDFDGAPPDREALRRAAAAFPDTAYEPPQFVFGSCFGFAMRRLRADFDPPEFESIVEDERFVAVGDARIDGREELLSVLGDPDLGCSSPDGDFVAAAFRKWGARMAEHLTGEFAIAAWSEADRTLHLMRDHFGARPLCYARFGSKLAFSSSTGALRRLVDDDGGLDPAAIADYIVIGERTNPSSTFLARLRVLPPAHLAKADSAAMAVSRYWDYPTDGQITASTLPEIEEELMRLYRLSVSDRLRSRRVSIELSGGLDSTSLAVLASDAIGEAGRSVSGLTMSYDGLFDADDARLAVMTGTLLRIPVTTVSVAKFPLFKGMEDPDGLLREQPGWGAFAAFWSEVLRVHEGLGPIAFTGEGGDYVLATEMRPLRWWWKRREVGSIVTSLLAAVAAGIRPRFGLRAKSAESYTAPRIPEWMDPTLVRDSGIAERAVDEALDERAGAGLPRPRMRALLARSRFEQNAECWHPAATGVALVASFPWFDRRLIEAALCWAPFPWLERKFVLRRAMSGKLPTQIVRRSKCGLPGDPFVAMIEAGHVTDLDLGPGDWEGISRTCHSMGRPQPGDPAMIWAWCRAVEVAQWRRLKSVRAR